MIDYNVCGKSCMRDLQESEFQECFFTKEKSCFSYKLTNNYKPS